MTSCKVFPKNAMRQAGNDWLACKTTPHCRRHDHRMVCCARRYKLGGLHMFVVLVLITICITALALFGQRSCHGFKIKGNELIQLSNDFVE